MITGSKIHIKRMDFSFPIWHVESLSPPSSQKENAEQTENQQLILDLQRVKVIGQTAAPNPGATDSLPGEFQEQMPAAGARNDRNTSTKLPNCRRLSIDEFDSKNFGGGHLGDHPHFYELYLRNQPGLHCEDWRRVPLCFR